MIQSVVGVGKMPPGGRIINIGTVYSKMGPSTGGSYAASKAAMDSMTSSLAGELGRSHGITVNCLAPGPVATDLSSRFLVNEHGGATAVHDQLLELTRAEERMGTVDDIADATLLLCSEKSRWITAQFISCSGGITGAS
jgi:NAD(P)-dependent dehydrogenase (short-subunit alcohol dehydrogenase family)